MIQSPRGTKDIFGSEAYLWNEIKCKISQVFLRFNFSRIETPTFENTELFLRGVGESSDIVQKEMYTFNDKSGRSLTLKPEGTAPTVRSTIQNNLFETNPKLFYITNAFRYERPQAGRYREFCQCGAEFFGRNDAMCDAETILLARQILSELNLENVHLKLNSIGCSDCRGRFNDALKNFIANNLDNLCPDCRYRFDSNPLRILDCKVDSCKNILSGAPSILDFLCDDCREHFEQLRNILKKMSIDFEIDDKIVRGLDYYNRTVFEFLHNAIAICGGGRYNNLVSQLGGKDTPAVGFAFGLERLISIIKSQGLFKDCIQTLDLFIGNTDENTVEKSFELANRLRAEGFITEYNFSSHSIKSQLKTALKYNAKYFLVIGQDELNSNFVTIKNLSTKDEKRIQIDLISKFLSEEIQK